MSVKTITFRLCLSFVVSWLLAVYGEGHTNAGAQAIAEVASIVQVLCLLGLILLCLPMAIYKWNSLQRRR